MARAALLLAVLLLAGCAAAAGGSPRSEDPVVGEWELVSGTAAGAPLPLPAGGRATAAFDGARVTGTAFCNTYGAAYRRDGDALRLEEVARTEMGCEPGLMAAEEAFLDALASVASAAGDGADLVLRGAGVELRFRPVAPVPPSSLAGTTWVLETLLDGDVASSTAGRSTLRLAGDGTVEGSTACATLTGRWQPTGDRLRFPELALEDTGCPAEARAQAEHEVAVLGSVPAIAVEEDRLTLLADDGRGLVYRATG
jgi:heat shock protein HslJ